MACGSTPVRGSSPLAVVSSDTGGDFGGHDAWPDGSAEDGYDPTRQFAEFAGDVRDLYPRFAGIRADSPVMEVHVGPEPSDTTRLDRKAPRMTSLFTVMNRELAQQVLTDDARFSSAGYSSFMGRSEGVVLPVILKPTYSGG